MLVNTMSNAGAIGCNDEFLNTLRDTIADPYHKRTPENVTTRTTRGQECVPMSFVES